MENKQTQSREAFLNKIKADRVSIIETGSYEEVSPKREIINNDIPCGSMEKFSGAIHEASEWFDEYFTGDVNVTLPDGMLIEGIGNAFEGVVEEYLPKKDGGHYTHEEMAEWQNVFDLYNETLFAENVRTFDNGDACRKVLAQTMELQTGEHYVLAELKGINEGEEVIAVIPENLYSDEYVKSLEAEYWKGGTVQEVAANFALEKLDAEISDEQTDEILEPGLDRLLAGGREQGGRENSNKSENEMKKERMIFEEQSTGRLLVVESTEDEFEFNSKVYDASLNLIAEKKIGTVFDDRNENELSKACDGAMEFHKIDKTDVMVFEEEEFEEMQSRRQKSIAANFVLEKLKVANIEVIADKGAMRAILEGGKLVQKMAAFHGTGGTEKSFDGYGAYVVSVNEGDAKQIGMKVASKKYGDAFYVKNQTFETFLKERKFSPYWAELLKQSRLDNAEELQSTMMLSDTKGNAELERQKNELSTLFKYGLVEHKREKAFVYSIDIPDDDGRNYLPYENPVGLESAEKINAALERLGTRWRVTRNDGGRQVYFNTLSEKVFNGSQEEASKFLKDAGLVGMRMNDRNYIVFDEKDISVNRRVQFMTDKNGEIYGFAHGGKIYLDPDLMNANTPAHEYTHLWDAYTRQTNLKLWERGKDIFRQTRLWNEVKGDPNYADIADDDDLLLSEVHARICGDIAQKVLERVAEQDGEIARDRAIDWDKEVTEYIASELGAEIAMPELGSESYVSDSIRHEIARNFLAQPMKDLMAGKEIALEREREKSEENALSEEDLEYIRSPEFIEKFGDWEKAQRLEKLKAAEAIIADGKIIVEGEEISENLDYLREDKNKKLLQILARNLGRQVVGIYHNDDLNIDVKVSMNNIDEIKHHNILFENHIEAIKNIPEIIQRAIYIGNESNSDKTRHPNITEYKYFATGLKIDGVDYTCKSVIGVDRNGNNYYDQSLSTIEKGRFVDIVMQKNKLGNLSPLISPWESEFEEDSNPSANYDKRLINICQVPQMKYLDKNLMPGKEAVEAVRNGTLRIEKRGQTEIMVDEARDAETERIQKMAKPAGNENNVAPSTAAESDYADPIETAEAWHNGTDEEREAMTREFASRRRDAASEGGFARVTAESADAGLFKDIHNEMRGDALARSTEDTLSAFRNIERLAAEAGNDAENGRLAREFVASLEERGVYLYKCGQKNLLRILDTRNLAAESGGIPETVPIEEAGSFFWNHHNVRTDGGKSTYDLMAEAHGTAYRRFHAKEAMRKILENGNDYELTEADTARIAAAGFRNRESLGDIGRLAEEAGKVELFQKISGAAFGREESGEKLQAGEKVEWIEERKTEKQKEPQQEKTAQAAEQVIPEEEAEQKEVTADPRQDENSLPSQMKEMRKMMEEQNRAIRMLQEKLIQAQKENSELHQTISMLQAQGPIMDDKSQAHESGREEGRGERPNSETQHLKNIDGFSSETAFNVNQKIPKFGKFSEETKKIEINDGCVFQKYIEHPTDKSMDKILYLDPKHTRINENGEEVHTFEMSAREYQKIINASEKYEARKLDMKNDYDWLYANEEYQTALKIDHDKFRRNTAANFFHNVRVSFRASGCQNVDDAMKCARNIVAKMTPYERKRFNEQRNEYGAEKFDQMLIKHFTNNRLELTEEELARLEVERKENKDSLLEQIKDKEKEPRYLQDGETIGETKTTVGSDLKIALHMTGFDGKRIKTPIDDFKIVKVTENFRPDKAILYSKKMKSSYTIPLATLEGYIKEMEQIQGKMEKVKAKSEKVEKKLLKRKEKRLTLDTGRVGR